MTCPRRIGTSSRCALRRSSSAAGRAASRWFWLGREAGGSSSLRWMRLRLCGEFDADPAIADEARGAVEHGLAAHQEFLLRAVGIDPTEDEIEERLARGDRRPQLVALGLVPTRLRRAGLPVERFDPDAQHLEHRARHLGEVAVLV